MTLAYRTPLPPETLAAHGVPADWRYGMADRVRFRELDVLNHVNNAVYLTWFETVRVAYVRDYGISRYRPEDPRMVLRATGAEFHAPLHLDDAYIVTARSTRMRRSSFQMAYGVFSGGRMAASGHAVIVMLEDDLRTRREIPDAIRQTLAARDGAVQE